MMTMQEAMNAPATAEVNWGELATWLLTPAQQDIYESLRRPAWDKYQAAVNANRHNHWTVNADIMPYHYNEYTAAVANAFKNAARSAPFRPHTFDSVAEMLNERLQPHHPANHW